MDGIARARKNNDVNTDIIYEKLALKIIILLKSQEALDIENRLKTTKNLYSVHNNCMSTGSQFIGSLA